MRISKKLGEAVRVALVFILISSWVFSAWPQVFRMPPKVEKAEAGGWYDAAWQYRQKITIDTSKVAGAATSFPVLVNRTDTALKSTDWGGHMGTATGAEILFTAGDGTTKLDHETEKFASTTGELVAWVRMPFLSSTSTNELYMYYGNASQADQQNKTAVWDEFYKGVWHLTTTSGPTTITYDSTVNLNTGTKLTATEPVDATGQIDGAQDFDGSNDYVGIANESNFDFEWSNPFSVSAWIRPDSTALASQTIAAKMESPPNRGWTLDLFDPSSGSDAVTFQLVNVESGSPIQIDVRSPSGVIEAGGLYHVVATYNGNGLASGVAIHINGVSQALTVVHDNLSGNTTLNDFEPRIGKRTDNSWPFDGLIDEVRVSNVSRSPSWIQTEYNNQSSPSTFMSFGIEEDLDRGVTPTGRSDTMSDSRTSEPSNHTLSFSVNSAVEASQSLEFTWPEGFSFTGGDSWYSNDWGFRKEIEIDKNKVAGAATSFPVLINSTLWEWKHTSSGGHVGNTSGWDFLFTGSDGTTKLDHEIEKYDSSTGELIAWVDVPFLSSTSNTVLYAYYGNPGAANQQNEHGVWDTFYKGVWHLTTTSGPTTITYDSTVNSNTGTKTSATDPFSTSTGTIDGAQDFSADRIHAGSQSSLDNLKASGGMTLSAWINPNSRGSGSFGMPLTKASSFGFTGWRLLFGGSNEGLEFQHSGTTGLLRRAHNNEFTFGVWQHLLLTWDGSTAASNVHIYKNGVEIEYELSQDGAGLSDDNVLDVLIGNNPFGNGAWDGGIDEARIANTVRSASWIQTEYNNQSSPVTFYSIGVGEENQPLFDCRDVDVATGTEFVLGDAGDCQATATHWGVTFATSARIVTLTAPTTAPYTYVATGTEITVEIGSNATNQYQGNSRINNPSAAGTYTITLGGTAGSSGWFLVAITGGLPVEATILESLALSVSSIGAGSCTADDGASVTAIGTSATSVPFGTISANTFYIGCQDLVVSTNAGGGYSLATQENLPLSTAGGQSVPDTTCNSGTCSQTVSGAWTTNTVNGFGHTCADVSGNDCNSVYGDGSYFRQFADMSSGETPQPIMVSSTPSLATGRVKYRLNVSSGQGAGIYSNTISYIITATY